MANRRTVHTPAVIERVLTLRRAGHTKAQIRDAVGIPEDHVARICADHRKTLPGLRPGNRSPAPSGAL